MGDTISTVVDPGMVVQSIVKCWYMYIQLQKHWKHLYKIALLLSAFKMKTFWKFLDPPLYNIHVSNSSSF